MNSFLQNKFKIWTKESSFKQNMINVFENIRDIPYAIVLEFFNYNFKKSSMKMLEMNKGFCVTKHYLLGMMFQEMGINVKYCIYPFKWSELNINYPKELKEIVKTLPIAYHLACKIFVCSKWIFLDATWDLELKKSEFLINESWDGQNDTNNAVNSSEEFIYDDIFHVNEEYNKKVVSYSLSNKVKFAKFSNKFNQWLEIVRNND